MRKLILPPAADSGRILPAPAHALTRRGFLRIAGTGVGALAFFPAIVRGAARPLAFQHGVASGDPLADRAIIWTRVTPEPGGNAGLGPRQESDGDLAGFSGSGVWSSAREW